MESKPDKTRIIAEELFSLTAAGGAAVATGLGLPAVAIALANAIIDCIFKITIADASRQPDAATAIARIRQQQAAASIDIFRDSLIQAAGLKPEFNDALEELADAVASRQDHRDDERYKEALLKLFSVVMGATSKLDDIKGDTVAIRQDVAAMREDFATLKSELLPNNEFRSSAISQSASPAQLIQLEIRVETLSAELRAQLDVQGNAKWDELNTALTQHTWDRLFGLANDLEQWLDIQGDRISPAIKGQALLSLADIALLRDSGFPFEARDDTKEAWRKLEKAEVAFGFNPSSEDAQRLLRARAKFTFVDGKRDEALKLLESTFGPSTVTLKIAFLQENNQCAEASDLAEMQSLPDKKWADEAITAHLRARQPNRAKTLLEWAKTQEQIVHQKCALAFIRTIYSEIARDGRQHAPIRIQDTNQNRLDELNNELIAAFASSLRDGPKSGIEAEALEMAMLIGHVRRDKRICRQAGEHLASWSPLSPELGRAILRRDIPPIKGLADRFIKDHPTIFDFQMIAAMLLVEIEGDAKRGMQLLRPMLLANGNAERKEEIGKAITVTGQYCDEETTAEALSELEGAFGASHAIPTMLRALRQAQKGNLLAAEAELAKVADDDNYLWLQHSAAISFLKKDWLAAARTCHRIAELTDHAEVYQKEAYARQRAGDIAGEIAALEHARRLITDDMSVVGDLANAYHQIGKYGDAANQLQVLWQSVSHTKALTLNYANCLALDGKVADAIRILEEHIAGEKDKAQIEPVLMYAQLLESQGKLRKAFDALLPCWDNLSNDHRYLMAVMHLGHANNEENEANRALQLLIRMLDAGALPKGLLQRFTLDELKEMSRGQNEQRKKINAEYLAGRLPWLLTSMWAYRSSHSVLAWRLRTQPLTQVDHPDMLAAYSIYSTNSFTVGQEDGQTLLVRVGVPGKDAAIVADISALITLYRLGLLTNLGTYFKRVLVPQSYKAIWIEEQRHIPHHQPSQIESRRAIVAGVKTGKIIAEADSTRNGQRPLLDEYVNACPPGRLVLRILQVAQWLAKAGKLSVEKLNTIKAEQNQPPLITDEEADATLRNGLIEVGAFTLQTAFDSGLLSELCGALQIHVALADFKQLEAELESQYFNDEAGQWHRDFVAKLYTVPNVEFVAVDADGGGNQDHTIHYGIDASLLAAQQGLPLMADDRYCQQARFNLPGTRCDSAFGTDVLLDRLADQSAITPQQHAEYWLQLIQWRYKFLLPQPSVLLTMATQFAAGLPGAHLRDVACYLHDSMRDVGLYGGRENVEPPTPMALRLYTAWLRAIADFIVRLWWDERFSEYQAAKLTKWIIRYFVPGRPRNLIEASWRLMSQTTRQALLGMIFTAVCVEQDVKKAYRLVSRIRRSLNITDDELASVVETTATAIVDDVKTSEQKTLRHVLLFLMNISYGPASTVGLRLLPLALAAGVIDTTKIGGEIPAELLAAITDRNHSQRLEPKVGPFAYVLRGQTVTALFMPQMFGTLSAASRQAIAENLLPTSYCPMCSATRALFQGKLKELCELEPDKWVPAALTIGPALLEDFELNAAAYSQSQKFGNDDGVRAAWAKIVRPTPEALLSIEADGWKLLPKSEGATDDFRQAMAAATSVSEFTETYDTLAGHLVMSAPLDLGGQLRASFPSSDAQTQFWPTLRPWLADKAKPWRRYHACQALLFNFNCIPPADRRQLWDAIIGGVEVNTHANSDNDDAQIWRLEAELAAHYLRCVDLGGYGLDEQRPLTIAWWAARTSTVLLTQGIAENELPKEIRRIEDESIDRDTRLANDAWFWICPKTYSPARITTLNARSPRGIALLIALGDFARAHGLAHVPCDVATRLRDCFTAALLSTAAKPIISNASIWMWDRSLIEAAETFVNALPAELRTTEADQIIALVKKSHESTVVDDALKNIATVSEEQALFVCSRVHLYCYEQPDAADVLLEHVRDPIWRKTCATTIPLRGWEFLAQGLLFLQAHQTIDWTVELPYVFLRLAEATSGIPARAGLFLTCMISASLVNDTVGAVKALRVSEKWLELRHVATILFRRIEKLRGYCSPEVSMRFRAMSAALEQCCGSSVP
jgi:Flp pilus assembly protein TadD